MTNRLLGVICAVAFGAILFSTGGAISLPVIILLICAIVFSSRGNKQTSNRSSKASQKKGSATRGAIFGAAAAYNEYKKQEDARNAARIAKEQAEKDRQERASMAWWDSQFK